MLQPIDESFEDALLNIAIDTLKKNKQMIVFVNTKRSAEAEAERIASKIKTSSEEYTALSSKLENVLSSPTKQCRRLGRILLKGIAFHHSGLHSEQKRIIEDSFREGKIKIICATTTLAAGMDLPAYRVVIRDLKRFGGGGWGMSDIPVLEYEQMSGRAGRPKFDNEGQAICIASNVSDKERMWEQYINGEPEEILSKLAVEPVLRMYVLSLVATGYVSTANGLKEFMSRTFYAYQYEDLTKLNKILSSILEKLAEWEFLRVHDAKKVQAPDFVSTNKLKQKKEEQDDYKIEATKLGERVAELYLDPETAHNFLVSMTRSTSKSIDEFSILQMISWTLEMRPMVKARQKEMDIIDEKIVLQSSNLITIEPSSFSDEYAEFVDSIKTSIVLEEWMNETSEEKMLEQYNVSPGELNAKLEKADWLLYSCHELSKLQGFRELSNLILKTRVRLDKGVKAELLPLIKLKGIGRVRARKLFNNRIRDLGDIKKADIMQLTEILGRGVAIDVKKQVGQEFSDDKIKVKPNKRKGQISLNDFDDK